MLTRRNFIAQTAGAGAALGVASAFPFAALAGAPSPRPVVSFHMDRPYIDATGTAVPYIPPDGLRSGEPAARLSEEQFRQMCLYV